MLEKAQTYDLPEIFALYRLVSERMEQNRQDQWHWGIYPNEQVIQETFDAGTLYVLRNENRIAAALTVDTCQSPEYEDVTWQRGTNPGLFHRLAVHPDMRGKGIGTQALTDAQAMMKEWGCDCLRCDTYWDNAPARRLYPHLGMREAGEIHLNKKPLPFVCFEKEL